MKNTKNHLDGNLVHILSQLYTNHAFKKNPLINSEGVRQGFLARTIIAARKDGLNWLWSYDDIYYKHGDEETNKGTDGEWWGLPSVDLSQWLDIDNHNNLQKFLFEKYKVKLTGCDWDVESSAWYPKFNTELQAKKCIDKLNKIFDKENLKGLKSFESWE
jgi:hypothetical protein